MSRRALVIILVALALFLIAASIKSGWLYLVSSVLISIVVFGFVSGRIAVRGVDFSKRGPQDAFEGEAFAVRLTVRNPGRLGRYFLLIRDTTFEDVRKGGFLSKIRSRTVSDRKAPETSAFPKNRGASSEKPEHSAAVAVERIAPGSRLDVEYEVSAPLRGVYEESEFTVSSGGILGTAGVTRRVKLRSGMIVFPKMSPVSGFPFAPRSTEAPLEAYEWSRKGIGQDYYGVREYVRGDSLRHIHWKSSARQGELIVKEYQHESRPTSVLVVLLAEPVGGDRGKNSMEDGLRCAASILNYYDSLGSAARLALCGGGSLQLLEEDTPFGQLRALAAYEPPCRLEELAGVEALVGAISQAAAFFSEGSPLTVITNAPPQSVAEALEIVNFNHGSSVVVVVDDSYGGLWDDGVARSEEARLEPFASSGVNVFMVTAGREIGRCLSEPLSVTAK